MTKPQATPESVEPSLKALVAHLLEADGNADRASKSPKEGQALKPGGQTPLWNVLREEGRKYLKAHGEQAHLARRLGLHRQAVNAYFTQGTRLPDGERTLQILLWLLEHASETE